MLPFVQKLYHFLKCSKKKKETTVKKLFLQAVGGLIGTKTRAGWHNISWKQTAITAFLQKGTATSSASNEPKTSGAQPSTSAGQLRVDCAVKLSTSAAYLDIKN
jgi:hypothetical protein